MTTRPLNSFEATALNERRASLRADGTLGAPISLIKVTDTCTRCGAACAPSPSFEVDALCTACKFDFAACDTFLPLPTPHDLHFAMREPAAAMPTNDPFEGYYREIGSWNL